MLEGRNFKCLTLSEVDGSGSVRFQATYLLVTSLLLLCVEYVWIDLQYIRSLTARTIEGDTGRTA